MNGHSLTLETRLSSDDVGEKTPFRRGCQACGYAVQGNTIFVVSKNKASSFTPKDRNLTLARMADQIEFRRENLLSFI